MVSDEFDFELTVIRQMSTICTYASTGTASPLPDFPNVREPKPMRRTRFALVLSFLAGLALLIGASVMPSSAAPSAYPPTQGRTLAVSTTNPAPGESITISGRGWEPGVLITITIHSQVVTLGTTRTTQSGSFSATVTIPSYLQGHHTLTASSKNGPFLTLNVFVAAHAGANSAPGSGKTSGGLPFTGVDVYALGGLSVALMLSGAIMLLTGRRRRVIAA